jgi:tryptophan-rich sensory protein
MNYFLIGGLSVIVTSLLSSYFTNKTVKSEWYKCISPDITPPSYVFPIVWSILYILIAISFSIAIKDDDKNTIYLFSSNLLLNILWCYLYFYKKNIKLAFVIILILITNTLAIIINMKSNIKYVLILYFKWLCFAALLNYKSIEKIDECKLKA